MDYWEKRALDRFEKAEEGIFRAKRDLQHSFRQAQREVQSQIDAFYGRYARNNRISLAEAQKALTLSELSSFRDDLASFRQMALDSMSTFHLELDNLSVKARITRLEALQCQMDAVVERMYRQQRSLLHGTGAELYQDQYYRTLFDIDRYQGFHSAFSQLDTDAVRRVLEYPFDGMDFSTRLWRQAEDLKPQLRQTLGRMFLTGRHPREYAQELAARFGVKEKEAYRLLYTEGAFAAEQGTLEAYRAAGVERYRYTAALDHKTCPSCGGLDGKTFAVTEVKEGQNYPPLHPWCRCTTIAEIGGGTGTRAARDPKTGRPVEVPGDMTYSQWRKRYVEKTLTDELPAAKILTGDEEWAVNEYISSGSYKINASLRSGETLTAEQQKMVTLLDSALEKMPVYEGIVYRSLSNFNIDDIDEFIAGYQVDEIKVFKEYFSTGTNVYDENFPIQYVIHSKNGRDLREINQVENEVLFRRSSKFKVVRVEGYTIYMEEQ